MAGTRTAGFAAVGLLLVVGMVVVIDETTRENVMESVDNLIGNNLLKAQEKALNDQRRLQNKGKDMNSVDAMLHNFQAPDTKYDSLTEALEQQAPKSDDLEIALIPDATGLVHFDEPEAKKASTMDGIYHMAEDIEFVQQDEDEVVPEEDEKEVYHPVLTKTDDFDVHKDDDEDEDGMSGDGSILSAVGMGDMEMPEESGRNDFEDLDLGLVQLPSDDNSELMKISTSEMERRLNDAVDMAVKNVHVADTVLEEPYASTANDATTVPEAAPYTSGPSYTSAPAFSSAYTSTTAMEAEEERECKAECPARCETCNQMCHDNLSQQCKDCAESINCQECRQCMMKHESSHSAKHESQESSPTLRKNAAVLKAFAVRVADKVADMGPQNGLGVLTAVIMHMGEKTSMDAAAQYLYIVKMLAEENPHGLPAYTLRHVNKAMEHGDGIVISGPVHGRPGVYFYINYQDVGLDNSYKLLRKVNVKASSMMHTLVKVGAKQAKVDTPVEHFTPADFNKLFKPSCVGRLKYDEKCEKIGSDGATCKTHIKTCKFASGWNGQMDLTGAVY